VETTGDGQPAAFGIRAIYPNPFNPATLIEVSASRGDAELAVYTVTGQKIRTLFSGSMEAGLRTFLWDGRDERGAAVSSGVYLVRFRSGAMTSVQRATMLK
jgi:flagellar hook assembly protein FlgD